MAKRVNSRPVRGKQLPADPNVTKGKTAVLNLPREALY